MNLITIYKRAPLPLRGNKTKWIKDLIKYFAHNYDKFEDFVFIDVFGGSGIVSSLLAKLYPNNKVIYNDFDYYTKLLTKSNIDRLNELRTKIYNIAQNYEYLAKINDNDCNKIRYLIKRYYPNFENNNKLKNIFAAWLMFNATDFKLNSPFYNRLPKNNYSYVDINDYLPDNVIIEHLEYKDLINKYKPILNKSLLILDPPYLGTSKEFYNKEWNLKDTYNILKLCIKYKCLLFEANSSNVIRLIKAISPNIDLKYKLFDKHNLGSHSKSIDYLYLFNI
jgi:16S rRNA G966 N2-methylase RsmD